MVQLTKQMTSEQKEDILDDLLTAGTDMNSPLSSLHEKIKGTKHDKKVKNIGQKLSNVLEELYNYVEGIQTED